VGCAVTRSRDVVHRGPGRSWPILPGRVGHPPPPEYHARGRANPGGQAHRVPGCPLSTFRTASAPSTGAVSTAHVSRSFQSAGRLAWLSFAIPVGRSFTVPTCRSSAIAGSERDVTSTFEMPRRRGNSPAARTIRPTEIGRTQLATMRRRSPGPPAGIWDAGTYSVLHSEYPPNLRGKDSAWRSQRPHRAGRQVRAVAPPPERRSGGATGSGPARALRSIVNGCTDSVVRPATPSSPRSLATLPGRRHCVPIWRLHVPVLSVVPTSPAWRCWARRGSGSTAVSWMHDTGHAPAYDHEGGVAVVVEDGTDPATPPDQIGPRVTGWRAGCQCGWHGAQLHLRAEWPDDEYAHAPEAVERRCRAEWERHLHAVLPGLSRHDDGRRVIRTRDDLVEASPVARAADPPWKGAGGASEIHRRAAQQRRSA